MLGSYTMFGLDQRPPNMALGQVRSALLRNDVEPTGLLYTTAGWGPQIPGGPSKALICWIAQASDSELEPPLFRTDEFRIFCMKASSRHCSGLSASTMSIDTISSAPSICVAPTGHPRPAPSPRWHGFTEVCCWLGPYLGSFCSAIYRRYAARFCSLRG